MRRTGLIVRRLVILFFMLLLIFIFYSSAFADYPLVFSDTSGKKIQIDSCPVRVVSLVPSITDMIMAVGAQDRLVGLTYHTTLPHAVSEKRIIGGFFSPSVKRIRELNPDVLFISGVHSEIRKEFENDPVTIVELDARKLDQVFDHITLIGTIFDRQDEAAEKIKSIKADLNHIKLKVDKIPLSRRKRVMRLMGRDSVMTPGDDSFQNDYIRAAGGEPPRLGRYGAVVDVTLDEWRKFNPQVIYACGGDRIVAKKFFDKPGWKDVDAVRNGAIYYYPCDLTCRASVYAGYFVSSLSADVYPEEFANEENFVQKNGPRSSKAIELDLDYVTSAKIQESYYYDFLHKTLVVDFKRKMNIMSTLEGPRAGVSTVGNHYSPPMFWRLGHGMGVDDIRKGICQITGRRAEDSGFLMTGADMDKLAVKSVSYKDMTVYALVTAGVRSNAVRMSVDEGLYYEPGTINVIILPNMKLTRRAMARAIISATEAKTAAMQDLDVRSTPQPAVYQATGTGTDNIIVVEGTGVRIDNAGGHTKMGELIAKAVYEGVREAVLKQNGLTAGRCIFHRLSERGINLHALIDNGVCPCVGDKSELLKKIEGLLLEPDIASFIEGAFAVSDARERGLIEDVSYFMNSCRQFADKIAGRNDVEIINVFPEDDPSPEVLKAAVNALFSGASEL